MLQKITDTEALHTALANIDNISLVDRKLAANYSLDSIIFDELLTLGFSQSDIDKMNTSTI